MSGIYDHYDAFFSRFPDLQGIRKGGKVRSKTARRVHGKFAPNDPEQPFDVDMESHRRGGIEGGRKRKVQVQLFGLRDERTGRFIKEDE